jgi:hypothetical protein
MDIQKDEKIIKVFIEPNGNLIFQLDDIFFTIFPDNNEELNIIKIKSHNISEYKKEVSLGWLRRKVENDFLAQYYLSLEKEDYPTDTHVLEDLYYIIPPHLGNHSYDEDDIYNFKFYGECYIAPFQLNEEALYQTNLILGSLDSSKVIFRSYNEECNYTRIILYETGEIKFFSAFNEKKIKFYELKISDSELELSKTKN